MMKTYFITILLLMIAASISISFTKEPSTDNHIAGKVLHSLPQAFLRQRVKAIYDSQIGVREATGHNDGPQVEQYLRYTGLGKGHAWCAAFVCWVLGQAGVENPRTAWAANLFPKEKLIWKQGNPLATGNTQLATKYQAQSGKRRDCFTPTPVAYASVRNDARATGNTQLATKTALRTTGNTQLATKTALRTTNNQQPITNKPSLTTRNTQLATIFGLYFPSLKRIAHCGFIDQWGEKEVITVEGNTNDSGSSDGDGVYRKRRPIKSLYAVADWIGKEGER